MDVNPVTNWNAPLVWEGTFDPVVIDSIYKRMDPRIAVIVFAVGKYAHLFLLLLLTWLINLAYIIVLLSSLKSKICGLSHFCLLTRGFNK